MVAYVGAPFYTMLIFRFPSLHSLRQYIGEREMQLYYTKYLPIYYNHIFLSLQYHA